MNKTLLALALMVVCFASCDKEVPKPLTKEEVQQCIDSLTCERKKEVERRANIELQDRLKIEVKVKVDSILQARSQQKAADTTPKVNPQIN